MAWGSKFQKSGGASQEKKPSWVQKKLKLAPVKEWSYLNKSLLRNFPDESGCMLKLRGSSVKKVLSHWRLRANLSAETSELVNRPPMGVNLSAASLQAGLEVLKEGTDANMGHAVLKTQLGTEEFGNALRRCQKDSGSGEEEIAKAMQLLMDTLAPKDSKKQDELGKALTQLADASSRLYGLAMAGLELRAALSRQKEWAELVPEGALQAPAIQSWMKDPSAKKLSAGVASALVTRFHWLQRCVVWERERRKASGTIASNHCLVSWLVSWRP